jgi:hypothetical protein
MAGTRVSAASMFENSRVRQMIQNGMSPQPLSMTNPASRKDVRNVAAKLAARNARV